jgi:hypothetical protein
VGVLSSLLYTLAVCQENAMQLRKLHQKTMKEFKKCPRWPVWKLYAIILVSYNEWSDCGNVTEFIHQAM